MPISFAVYQMRIAHEHNMIASLYTDLNDPDAFCSGYIECVTSKHVLFAALTPWGYRDGWLLWRVGDVQQVFTGDEYEARLEILVNLREVKHTPLFSEAVPPNADLLRMFLRRALNENLTISILTADETYTGKPRALDDLRVSIDAYDFFGVKEAEMTQIPLRDIEQVMLGTEEEKMFDMLHSANDAAQQAQRHSDGEIT